MKAQLRQLYRSQQILHAVATDLVEHVLPICICVAEFLLITSIYTVIRLFHSSHIFVSLVIGSIGVVAFLALGIGIETTGSLAKASEQYIELKSLNSTLRHVHFSRHDRMFFRSCQPLKFRVAHSFTVSRDTFIIIIDSIVINSVINLLVAF